MDIIAKVFAEQWIFMLIAVVAVAVTFLVKKFVPNLYETFLKGSLVILSVLLIILALLFQAPDLFLLIPIIVICCELFGYGVTSKIVSVLFVDFLLIQLDFRLIAGINEAVMNVIFFVLQIIAAIIIGFIMDGYLREKKANESEKSEIEVDNDKVNSNADNSEEKSVNDIDNIINNVDSEEN
ncbi:MAG: hypothetical protein UH239_08000 [Acutalibacteraceae bacterium]|nr:hypothetical protein [Acutalibacteraceae bacterium]